ncbi:hypothetical protein B9Z55_028126 [Caenorhabditis nigoni]|uniref:Uncharacterized protein n=1 Tax=Caenorhabditis nigoni TaxID=1611254 RepID=A0A2G5SD97_9PELO|nr:hypothetical protein B9Z55_028126 [Caenorhabditis nigoni]
MLHKIFYFLCSDCHGNDRNLRTIPTFSERFLESYKEAQAAEAAIEMESIFYKAIDDGIGKSHIYFSMFIWRAFSTNREPATGDLMKKFRPEIQGNISLKSVKLTYSRRTDHPVMTNLTFSARSGQTIASVGPSGA